MKVFIWAVLCCVIVAGQLSIAAELDLTTLGSQGMVNDAIFVQMNTTNSSGSGTFGTFLGINNKNSEEGFNTAAANPGLDTKSASSLLLGAVPVVNVAGTEYREFILDVNETANHPWISLDALQIALNTAANLSSYSAIFSSVIYDLDAGEDSWIGMDYSLNAGSGKADLSVLVPSALFGTDESQYVYLYAKMGVNYATDDGFEEWGVGDNGNAIVDGSTVIPEPATLLLVGLGSLFLRRIKYAQI